MFLTVKKKGCFFSILQSIVVVKKDNLFLKNLGDWDFSITYPIKWEVFFQNELNWKQIFVNLFLYFNKFKCLISVSWNRPLWPVSIQWKVESTVRLLLKYSLVFTSSSLI